jgi:hypothetical protein
MSTPPDEYKLDEPQLLAVVSRLARDLRIMRSELELEKQQAEVGGNASKRTTIKQALSRVVNRYSPSDLLTHLDDISQGKCPWIPSATRGKDDVLDAIGEVVNDGSKIGQDWLELLRTYQVTITPVNPLFNR